MANYSQLMNQVSELSKSKLGVAYTMRLINEVYDRQRGRLEGTDRDSFMSMFSASSDGRLNVNITDKENTGISSINSVDPSKFAGTFVNDFKGEVDREIERRTASEMGTKMTDAQNRLNELLNAKAPQAPGAPVNANISSNVQEAITANLKNRKRTVNYLTSSLAGETGNVSGQRVNKASATPDLLGTQKTLLGV